MMISLFFRHRSAHSSRWDKKKVDIETILFRRAFDKPIQHRKYVKYSRIHSRWLP